TMACARLNPPSGTTSPSSKSGAAHALLLCGPSLNGKRSLARLEGKTSALETRRNASMVGSRPNAFSAGRDVRGQESIARVALARVRPGRFDLGRPGSLRPCSVVRELGQGRRTLPNLLPSRAKRGPARPSQDYKSRNLNSTAPVWGN